MSPGPTPRKRSSRACDGCKSRRMKCEELAPSSNGEMTCKLCREAGTDCTFETPVRKRGPAPGFRRRNGNESPGSGAGSRPHDQASPREHGMPVKRRRLPSLGSPPGSVDESLAVYFTSVHCIWPLIYKPMFNPHTASAPSLLSMLAISACSCPPQTDGIDGDKLYAMAESASHHCRNESRIDIIQALMISSLRQTGVGDKRSAFTYAGRAATMASNSGSHLAPTTPSEAGECESRSRVFWNVYVLDKILAEESGRPLFSRYRRSSTPLPSETESDEFEPWPPQSPSSAPVPAPVRHITPRRGHIMSFFVWTCRMGMIIEDISDLEVIGPPVYDSWDRRFIARIEAEQDTWRRAERIAEDLVAWREAMPAKLEVNSDPNVSPSPHHVVGSSWYHTARISSYSRFSRRRSGHGRGPPSLVDKAHRVCSESAEACIDMSAHLDRHKSLSQCSSDCIHMMSVITSWEAFDASSSDPAIAHRAKLNFAQCCIWSRDFSSSWPAASAHKLFFEGLIQGGSKSSSGDMFREDHTPESEPRSGEPGVTITEGSRSMGRNLADGDEDDTPRQQTSGHESGQPISQGSQLAIGQQGQQQQPNLFNSSQFYWNHSTTTEPAPGEGAGGWESDPGLAPQNMFGSPAEPMPPPQRTDSTPPVQFAGPSNYFDGGGQWGNPPAQGEGSDQAAIYAASMSYMVEAAKGR